MRWDYIERSYAPDWERWFAWFPVRVGNKMVRLETVQHKHVPSMDGYLFKNINQEM